MNHNSSRFGKFTRIHFDKRNWLVGADLVTYLLEKSRTVTQSKDERNYHAFYQLFAGSSKAELQALKLTTPQSYSYLEKGMINVDAIDDKARHQEVWRTLAVHHHHPCDGPLWFPWRWEDDALESHPVRETAREAHCSAGQ